MAGPSTLPAIASPQGYARAGGVLYLAIFAAAAFSMIVQAGLVVPGDAGATASRIAASQPMWRAALTAEAIMFGCDVPLALIFYVLLRPVDADLALLAALFRFAEAIVGSVGVVWHLAPLALLSGSGYLTALQSTQLDALTMVSLKLFDATFAIALIPFGVHCVLLGYLIFKSGYLPKTLGVLMFVAGICYVVNSMADLLAPGLARVLFPAILLPALPAELGLCLWLLVAGVNLPKWNAKLAQEGARSY